MASRSRRQIQTQPQPQIQPKFEIGDKLQIELPNVSVPSIYLVIDRQMKDSTVRYTVIPETNPKSYRSTLIQDSRGKLSVENSTQIFRIEKVLPPMLNIEAKEEMNQPSIPPRRRNIVSKLPPKIMVDQFKIPVESPPQIPIDQFEFLPGDVLFEIGLNIPVDQIPRYCQLSRRFNQEVCAKEYFWPRKLDREFPNRIQKDSQKLGTKNYLFWLDRARKGLIEPRRLDGHLIDLKEGETFTIPSNANLKYTGDYKILEFDRFGYYPDYYFRVKNLETGKIHQMMISHRSFYPTIFEDDPSTLVEVNESQDKNFNKRISLFHAQKNKLFTIKDGVYKGMYRITKHPYRDIGKGIVTLEVENKTTLKTKKLIILMITTYPIIFDNDWLEAISGYDVFNFFEFSCNIDYPVINYEGNFLFPEQFNLSGNDHIFTLKFYPNKKEFEEEFFEFRVKYDRSYEITGTEEANKYLTYDEILVEQMIDFAFDALPEHIGRYLRWTEFQKAHPELKNLKKEDKKILDQLGWW